VQVDSIKSMLKVPGTGRLKLKDEEPLSNFRFKFNLRRYTAVLSRLTAMEAGPTLVPAAPDCLFIVYRYTGTHSRGVVAAHLVPLT